MADPTRAQQQSPTAPESDGSGQVGPDPGPPQGPGKALTIGAVCKALSQEFPDISISKIRYLEDQKLLTPRRTPGGYRLYSSTDVSRLRTILRLQRDEFLPLRVIRQELAAGRSEDAVAKPKSAGQDGTDPAPEARPGAALRRLTFSIAQRGAMYSLEDVVQDTGADPRLVAELADFGIIQGQARDVALAVEPVAARRALGLEELLVLEVADLGDRDVVELLAQDLGDGADGQRLAGARRRIGAAPPLRARAGRASVVSGGRDRHRQRSR